MLFDWFTNPILFGPLLEPVGKKIMQGPTSGRRSILMVLPPLPPLLSVTLVSAHILTLCFLSHILSFFLRALSPSRMPALSSSSLLYSYDSLRPDSWET